MIEKKDIIAVARHIFRRGQGAPDRRLMHPMREWLIGVACASAVFVGGAAYAGFLFVELSGERRATVSVDDAVAVYDQAAVSAVLAEYGERDARFRALRTDRSNAGALFGREGERTEEENSTTTEAVAEEEGE